ncbi:MAG TPA: hypothetical protein VMV69_07465 [Pirellulales bacterium]|nr:hypothetical protein [Pirellulales bacterium]
MPGRIIGTRLPCCPGKDSRFTIKHNVERAGTPWWVFYDAPGSPKAIAADDPHTELVQLINALKEEVAGSQGGPFSINEHGQVIARAKAPAGPGNTIHIINVTSKGTVSNYQAPILFGSGKLDPRVTPKEGDAWPGPLSGMSYKFAAPGNPKPPSRRFDEIFVEEEGVVLQISTHAGIDPYPPTGGLLAPFLGALRRQLPNGGRFRVNEFGRAFTSNGSIYIGSIPHSEWFRPLTARS